MHMTQGDAMEDDRGRALSVVTCSGWTVTALFPAGVLLYLEWDERKVGKC